jgi:hypothetical protein
MRRGTERTVEEEDDQAASADDTRDSASEDDDGDVKHFKSMAKISLQDNEGTPMAHACAHSQHTQSQTYTHIHHV